MELVEEIYQLRIELKKELTEIRKLLIPISLHFAEELRIMKGGECYGG